MSLLLLAIIFTTSAPKAHLPAGQYSILFYHPEAYLWQTFAKKRRLYSQLHSA